MVSLRTLSIPRKIVVIAMTISVSALLLAGASLTGYDFFAARRDLRAATRTFAQIVADNTSAALAFNDQAAAAETLNSLRAEPSIVSACIYKSAELFAEHVAAGRPPCPKRASDAKEEDESILASSAILLKDQHIGTVQLVATLAPAYARLRVGIGVLSAILLMSVLFAFALSARLQKFVSEPILNLAQTAKTVSWRKDYSLRVRKEGEDELGILVDSFNEMLEHIQAREAELVHANRVKDDFLTTLSHELRTPLTPILGWTKLLLQHEFDPSQLRRAIETIDRNAELQAHLVEDLLDVARITSGKLTMDFTTVDLRQVIETAVQSAIPAVQEKHLYLESAIRSVPVIRGNAARLQQVMWNLLSNAIKFTPEGGSVHVDLEQTPDHVQISVSDTGIGIHEDFLPYIFDRFRQADSSYTRRHGGLGLGLAIVKQVVEQHSGSVSAYSRGDHKGSTFIVSLPIAAANPVAGPLSVQSR